MRKRNGFTLAELVVSLAVMTLILGGIVGIFGTSMRSLVAGHAQSGAYAEAREAMNDLKTTLRYAAKNSSTKTGNITISGSKIEYSGTKVKDLTKGIKDSKGETFSRTVEWANADHTQIKITKVDNDKTTTVIFPQNVKNSAFNSDDYKKVYKEVSGSAPSDSPFPIFTASFEGKDMYNIVLPIKYSAMGITKVDVLQSRVSPEEREDATTSADTTITKAEILAATVAALFKDNPDAIKIASKDKFVSQISSGSLAKADGLAGATLALRDYLADIEKSGGKVNGVSNPLSYLGDTAWVISSCDKNGKIVNGSQTNVYSWKISVADNVTNCNDNKTTAENKADAANGIYNIRANWGFKVQQYSTQGTSSVINETSRQNGFSTGVWSSGFCIIDAKNWQASYLDLQTKKTGGTYIEDINSGTGTHTRIDYDGSGAEYTKDTAGVNYSYPPDGATVY